MDINLNKYRKKRNYCEMIKVNQKFNNNTNQHSFGSFPLPKLIYNNNITPDLEVNNISNNIKINKTDNIYNTITDYLINIYITKITNWKRILPENYFNKIEVIADGNCFFRSVSKFFGGNEENHLYFRNVAYNYILKNKDKFIENNNIEYKDKVISLDEYISKINKPFNYSGELEIFAISKSCNISIYVFQYEENIKGYRLLYKYENENPFCYCMILKHEYLSKTKESQSQHFSLLIINKFRFNLQSINDNNINNNYITNGINNEKKNIKFVNINENSKIDISSQNNYEYLKDISINNDSSSYKYIWSNDSNENPNSSKLEEESNNNLQYTSAEIADNTVNNNSDKEDNNIVTNEFIHEHNQIKEIIENIYINDTDKLNKLINIINKIIYPIYKGEYNGNNFYMDKHLYLLTKKFTTNIRYYPDYIKYEENNSIKENKKRYFRSSCINYELDEEYYLCFKKIKNSEKQNLLIRRGNNRHIKKRNEEYDLFRIPTVKNIIGLLEQIHRSIFHLGKKNFLIK